MKVMLRRCAVLLRVSIVAALLISCSLRAVVRSHVLVFEVALNAEDKQRLIGGIDGAVASINAEVITPHNALIQQQWDEFTRKMNEKKAAEAKLKKLLPKIDRPTETRRPNVFFYEADQLHITLAYIGDLDDTDPRYQEITNAVQNSVQQAIDQWSASPVCQQIDLAIGSLMWPPWGLKRKIWLVCDVQPASENASKSLLALINGIQHALAEMQKKYANPFKDYLDQNKTFEKYATLKDVKVHMAVGRLEPEFKDSLFVGLNDAQKAKFLKILEVKNIDNGPTMLGSLSLKQPTIVLNKCAFTAKSVDGKIHHFKDFIVACKPPLEAPFKALKAKQEQVMQEELKQAQEKFGK
jgi:hypothetical protein